MKSTALINAMMLLCAMGTPGIAADLYEVEEPVYLRGSIGYTFIKADEIVFDADNRISHLIWESQAPSVSATLGAETSGNWTVALSGTFAGMGNSSMEDYDWLSPFAPSYDFDDWTDRSIHPDTRLDHYFTGDIALGRNVDLVGGRSINLHAGVKYTDVKWTAYGGSYTYSNQGYRDASGTFSDGERGITFQQRYPGAFVGADFGARQGRWGFSGQLRGGAALRPSDTDHHWMRNLRFEDSYDAIPFATASARLDYAMTGTLDLFLTGTYEHYFETKGDAELYDIPSGIGFATYKDGAGMALKTATVAGGVKMRF